MEVDRLVWSQYRVSELRKLSENDFIDLLRSVWGAGNVIGQLELGVEHTPDFAKWGPDFMSAAPIPTDKGAEITPAYHCHKVNKPTRGPTHFDEITISPKELAGWLEGGIVDFILESTCCTGDIPEEECPHKKECIEAWLRQPAEKAEKRGDDRLSLEGVGDIVANKC